MLSLHTNASVLSTQNAVGRTQMALSSSMTKLGTGFRINSAMDDAAGLQIATRLNAQSRGMTVAMRNTQNGISMLQVGEGAFEEITNILYRMKDLATEGGTASATADDKNALQAEFDALGKELANIVKNTSFGGEKLFSDGTVVDGTAGKFSQTLNFQIGAASAEQMTFDVGAGANDELGTLLTAMQTAFAHYDDDTLTTAGTEITAGANAMIDTVNNLLNDVGSLRSQFGASANRLNHVYNNLSNMQTQTDQAKGRIMDVDYASETANMTSKQLLMQASTSMLKQSSSMSQLVLSLMQ